MRTAARRGLAAVAVLATACALAEPVTAGVDPERAVGRGAWRTPDGLLAVKLPDGTVLHTHGLDRTPPSALRSIFRDAPPERAPACAKGHRHHVLHAYVGTDTTPHVREQIRTLVRRADAMLDREARSLAGIHADYRVACDETGAVAVDGFAAPAQPSTLADIALAARRAGFDHPEEHYLVFYDGVGPTPWATGAATMWFDDDLVLTNRNNTGGGFAVVYAAPTWGEEAVMHEMAHNQGAVQRTAPNATTAGHCTDEEDVMCYADEGPLGPGTRLVCADRVHFDCNGDDYFNPGPARRSYLATHWNTGSPLNRFIEFSGP